MKRLQESTTGSFSWHLLVLPLTPSKVVLVSAGMDSFLVIGEGRWYVAPYPDLSSRRSIIYQGGGNLLLSTDKRLQAVLMPLE